MPSMRDMRTAPPQESSKYSINTQEAVRAMPSSIRRPNASTDFLWRKVVMIESINTANVVLLIPPAVEHYIRTHQLYGCSGFDSHTERMDDHAEKTGGAE